VVQFNTLFMGSCSRLQVAGVGKVDLRIGAATGEAIHTIGHSNGGTQVVHFGVGSADTYSAPQPLSADRLTVYVNSNGCRSTAGSCTRGLGLCPQGGDSSCPSGPSSGQSGSPDCDTANGNVSCAVFLMHATGGATIVAPNGTVQIDDDGNGGALHGAVMSNNLLLSNKVQYQADLSGLPGIGTSTYGSFNKLMSWKDQ